MQYSIPFFNHSEIEFFYKWADKTYDPNNPEHYKAKEYIIDTVWKKTQFWSDEIAKRLPNYKTYNKRNWQKPGWENGERVATFKPYTWARIFKLNHSAENIFFTVGIGRPHEWALVYKLDYFKVDYSKLNEKQKELCEKYISKELRQEISLDKLNQYNWGSLIQTTVKFISENSHHYDQVVAIVWGKQKEPGEIFNNSLTKREFPKSGLYEEPSFKHSFNENESTAIQENVEREKIGKAGEELVKHYEMNKLKESGMVDKAKSVEIKEDGAGYDVLSFDEHGNEKYIEVKNTEGNEKIPFYLSANEKKFCELNKSNYVIYRLYNYDSNRNHADFFIIQDPLNSLYLTPKEYIVHLKNKHKL